MRLFFASGIILFIRAILHIKCLQKAVGNNVVRKKRHEQWEGFSSLAALFSRATGLETTVIEANDNRLPAGYGGLNFFALPLIQDNTLSGYIICDHHNATDNQHRAAAIRLLHFIVNNMSAIAENREVDDKPLRHKREFYYSQKSSHEIKLLSALRYIDENLYGELSLEAVAAHVCLSANYFSRFFKKRQGVNFKVWVNQRKMQRAGELLGDPSYSVDSVARKLQFAQTSYFCRVFRAAHRTSPQSFRDRHLAAASR